MSIAPKATLDFLEFCKLHIGPWTTTPSAVGLSAPLAASFQASYDKAQASYDDAESKNAIKKAATLISQDDVRALRRTVSECLGVIKGFAETQPSPAAVYAAAEIPAPLPPSPAPAPGTPTEFSVGLSQSGVIMLAWKCANPTGTTGTIYEVRRRTGMGAWNFIGATGVKAFDDDTLMSSAAVNGVTYEITAVRSTKRGLPAQFNVNFGIGGDGAMVASVENVPSVPVRMAA